MSKKKELITMAMLIKSHRTRVGMTQTEMGEALGVTRAFICDIEKGRRNFAVSSVIEVSEALGINPEIVFKIMLRDVADKNGFEVEEIKLKKKVG